jgi:hypothetical protein
MVVFPRNGDAIGDYIDIYVERANSATLFGTQITEMFARSTKQIKQEG